MVVIDLATLVFSIVILARSSAFVVDNAVRLSRFFGISQLAMGFILISVATSLPELSIAVVSSSAGEGAISAGNVFGANIANILFIIGAGAFLYRLKISNANLQDIGLVLLTTTAISVYIVFHSSIYGNALGLPEGALLLGIFGAFTYFTLKKRAPEQGKNSGEITKAEALRAFLFFGMGIIAVIFSSGFVVESAVALSRMLGIAESFIGATVIAIGTTLPELSVSMYAIKRGQAGLALGNVLGSNMVNITMVLGTAAALNPIQVRIPVFIAALLFAVLANMLLFYFAAINRGIGKFSGALLLAMYAAYIWVIFTLQVEEISAI